jgi:signal transduction histidine kinase
LDKVFTSFYRGTNVATFQGNGIGLYVTGKIIKLFNGTINVSSETGNGTIVTIQFNR